MGLSISSSRANQQLEEHHRQKDNSKIQKGRLQNSQNKEGNIKKYQDIHHEFTYNQKSRGKNQQNKILSLSHPSNFNNPHPLKKIENYIHSQQPKTSTKNEQSTATKILVSGQQNSSTQQQTNLNMNLGSCNKIMINQSKSLQNLKVNQKQKSNVNQQEASDNIVKLHSKMSFGLQNIQSFPQIPEQNKQQASSSRLKVITSLNIPNKFSQLKGSYQKEAKKLKKDSLNEEVKVNEVKTMKVKFK